MIMVNEDKRFCEMYWKNWNIGISNLTESNSYNFEYEKINTMFEMSLSSYVKWNDELKNSNVLSSVFGTHQDTDIEIRPIIHL